MRSKHSVQTWCHLKRETWTRNHTLRREKRLITQAFTIQMPSKINTRLQPRKTVSLKRLFRSIREVLPSSRTHNYKYKTRPPSILTWLKINPCNNRELRLRWRIISSMTNYKIWVEFKRKNLGDLNGPSRTKRNEAQKVKSVNIRTIRISRTS